LKPRTRLTDRRGRIQGKPGPWRRSRQRLRKQSVLSLQMRGFALVVLPLLIGLVFSGQQIDRVLRVNPETAGIWLAGVENLETWSARLEHALLEALGPAEMREAGAGLESLRILLEEAPTESARETLAVIVDLIEHQVSLAIERDRVARELEAERQAHRKTTDKPNALRQIDHQLDERENNGGQ